MEYEMNVVQTMQEMFERRASAYRLLSCLYLKEVDEQMLGRLRTLKLPSKTGNNHLDLGYRKLCVALGSVWERTLTEWAADYFHTFIGSTTEISHAAFPYESVYTSEEHLLMQDSRDEVLQCYRDEMIILEDGINEPEDHIAFELAFMALLSDRAAEFAAAGTEQADTAATDMLLKSYDFLRQHPMRWVEDFNADIQRVARTELYHALGEILVGYLQTDEELLGTMLSDVLADRIL